MPATTINAIIQVGNHKKDEIEIPLAEVEAILLLNENDFVKFLDTKRGTSIYFLFEVLYYKSGWEWYGRKEDYMDIIKSAVVAIIYDDVCVVATLGADVHLYNTYNEVNEESDIDD